MSATKGWIGVDLDGTLAYYDKWRGIEHIGEPVPVMLDRVKKWLDEGRDVRIFTARVGSADDGRSPTETIRVIQDWCLQHLGKILRITCSKDLGMVELWDDRCIQVITNSGERADGNL